MGTIVPNRPTMLRLFFDLEVGVRVFGCLRQRSLSA